MEEALPKAHAFVCLLYDTKGKYESVNCGFSDRRVNLSSKGTGKYLAHIPPCGGSFIEHTKRAIYQTKIQKKAHRAYTSIGRPEQFGWKRVTGHLQPVYFLGPTASELLNDLVCNCKPKEKCSQSCTCKEAGMPYIQLCKCESMANCRNPLSHKQVEDQEDDQDNDD